MALRISLQVDGRNWLLVRKLAADWINRVGVVELSVDDTTHSFSAVVLDNVGISAADDLYGLEFPTRRGFKRLNIALHEEAVAEQMERDLERVLATDVTQDAWPKREEAAS